MRRLWGVFLSIFNFTPRFLGFSVYVSNITDKSEGTLCFKDRNYTVNTIPSVININCPMHGQYVIYYNEMNTDMLLMTYVNLKFMV